MFSTTDTIVAIATPQGRGGIGVVRLSGIDAPEIARRLTGRSQPFAARHATYTHIVEASSETSARPLDQVVVTRFEAPHSFTGEDVVEISGHGSPVLLRRIVEIAMAAGARLAEPGEFTLRAHLNGRLDLIQAEAVADLVEAVTPLQARAAMDQLEGTLTTAIGAIDARLFDLSARLEASLDFPEEGFHFITRDQAAVELAAVRGSLERLVEEGRAGRVVRDGSIVVISGRPNAGKSSLFNALVGAARAIVTDVPGTTRDLLTERVDMDGLLVTLVDTAGVHETSDTIEIEGIRRAKEARAVAALTILVVDASDGLPSDDLVDARETDDESRIVVMSKVDRPRAWTVSDLGPAAARAMAVSVVTGEGLAALRRRIIGALTSREEWRDPPAVSNLRHLGHLADALDVVRRAEDALGRGATEELVLAELAHARQSLEEISGRKAPDDLLRHIFSRFCVGK